MPLFIPGWEIYIRTAYTVCCGVCGSTRWCSRLALTLHCRKVAGSIPRPRVEFCPCVSSSFLPQSKNNHLKKIRNSKLAAGARADVCLLAFTALPWSCGNNNTTHVLSVWGFVFSIDYYVFSLFSRATVGCYCQLNHNHKFWCNIIYYT